MQDSAGFGAPRCVREEPGFPAHHEWLDSGSFRQIIVDGEPAVFQTAPQIPELAECVADGVTGFGFPDVFGFLSKK